MPGRRAQHERPAYNLMMVAGAALQGEMLNRQWVSSPLLEFGQLWYDFLERVFEVLA